MFGLEMWNYRHAGDEERAERSPVDVSGFGVEAIDGSIGKVDAVSHDTDQSFMVVDTGRWIFGKKVMLPAGVIDCIDYDEGKIHVHRTKDEVKHAPEYDDSLSADMSYRSRLQAHYGAEGAGDGDFGHTRETQLTRR